MKFEMNDKVRHIARNLPATVVDAGIYKGKPYYIIESDIPNTAEDIMWELISCTEDEIEEFMKK